MSFSHTGAMMTGRFLKVLFIGFVGVHVLADVTLSTHQIGGDFSMRYHEVECIRRGVDPFAVWKGSIHFPPYYGYGREPIADQNKMVCVYPPWEYTLLAPLAHFPLPTASRLFRLLEIAAVCFLAGFGFRFARRRGCTGLDAVFCTAWAFVLGMALQNSIQFQNYGIVLTALVAVLALALAAKRDILAGFCLAALLVKPQFAALFFIPLAMQRKWRVISIALSLCLLASLWPAIRCGVSPLRLVTEIFLSGEAGTYRTILLPDPVFALVQSMTGISGAMATSAALGSVACAFLCWKLRSADAWIVKMLPCCILAPAWTYSQFHDRCLYFFPLLFMAMAFIGTQSQRKRTLLVLTTTCLASTYLFHFHPKSLSWIGEAGLTLPPGFPGKVLYAVILAASLLGTVLAAVFCLKMAPTDPSRPSAADSQ